MPTADEVWAAADLLLKVKEPIAQEYHRLRRDQVLFTYLHLAARGRCTEALLDAGTTAIAYETVQLPDGSLPLLAPMSEVAGRLAPQVGRVPPDAQPRAGAACCSAACPACGTARSSCIGGGVAGAHAAAIALGMRRRRHRARPASPKLRQLDAQFARPRAHRRLQRLHDRRGGAARPTW